MKYSLSVIDTELWYVGYAPELEFTKVYKNPSLFENLKNNSYSSAVFEWAIIQWTLFFSILNLCLSCVSKFWTRPWHSKLFGAKRLLLSHYESAVYKNIHNLFQGPPNPVCRWLKVQTDLSQKGLTRFQKFYLFRFLMNP